MAKLQLQLKMASMAAFGNASRYFCWVQRLGVELYGHVGVAKQRQQQKVTSFAINVKWVKTVRGREGNLWSEQTKKKGREEAGESRPEN